MDNRGQGLLNMLVVGGVLVGVMIILLQVMAVLGLETYSAGATALEGVADDGNGTAFKASYGGAVADGFVGIGQLGSFMPIVVIVVVVAVLFLVFGNPLSSLGGGGSGVY